MKCLMLFVLFVLCACSNEAQEKLKAKCEKDGGIWIDSIEKCSGAHK